MVNTFDGEIKYWRMAEHGTDVCLSCTEDICYYDRESHGATCPILAAIPNKTSKIFSVLDAIEEEVRLHGPKSAVHLNIVLQDKYNFSRHAIYQAIRDDRLIIERIPIQGKDRNGNQRVKIIVKGVKR